MSVISPVVNAAESAKPASASAPSAGVLRTVGRWVAYLLFLVAALAALAMILVPLATGSQTYTVLTNSMAPKYAPGTFMVVKPAPVAELRAGDIITYQIESGKAAVITHRIVAVGTAQNGGRVFTTKGDNNSLADPAEVHDVQIKGKLFYAVPYVGFVANAAGHLDKGVLLPIVAAGLIGYGGLSMVRGAMDKKRAPSKHRHSA